MKRFTVFSLFFVVLPSILFAGKPAPSPTPFVPAIAYVQRTSTTYDLMLLNADGTQKKMLVGGTRTASAGAPSFSPDGTMIVFRYGAALYVVPTASGTPWKVVNLLNDWGTNVPAWSPDGRFILYSDRTDPSAYGGGDSHLFLVEVDNTGHALGAGKRLTSTNTLTEMVPSWSRDGSRFTALGTTPNGTQLFVFDFDRTLGEITGAWCLSCGLGLGSVGTSRAQWNKSSTTFANDIVVFSAFSQGASSYTLWYIDVATLRFGRLVAPAVAPSFSPNDGRVVFVNGDLQIVENASDVINGTAIEPLITHTVATTTSKVVDVMECDWMPVP